MTSHTVIPVQTHVVHIYIICVIQLKRLILLFYELTLGR